MTHTPIPWRAWPDGAITSGGPDNNHVVVAQVEMESTSEEQGMADAHLIVTAVNAHEELLAAFTNYLEAEDIYNKAVTPQATAKAGYAVREKREAARAAIAKAKQS